MNAITIHDVEFIGGPLDGYVQRVSLPVDQLEEIVLLPLGKVLAVLHEDQPYDYDNFNTLAIYELFSCISSSTAQTNYYYVGSVETFPA